MSASHSVTDGKAPYYYVPADSAHPVRASIALLIVLISAALWVNSISFAPYMFGVGLLMLFVVLWGWFGDAIRESEAGLNSQRVDHSYRWSMAWFIFSEVMFFAAFFGSLLRA